MLAAELHAHSDRSHDGRDSVDRLLERAATVGLDALAVTDHDTMGASLDAVDRAPDHGLIGIPAVEVSSVAGHVIALGVRDAIPAGLSFGETLDRIRERGGVAVLPHPFASSRSGVADHVSRDALAAADAIEVYNSRLLTGRANRRAERFARARGLPTTAGSDAHVATMVGRAITHVDADDRTASAICDAIREGRTVIDGRRTPLRISVRQAAGGAKRRVRDRIAGLLD